MKNRDENTTIIQLTYRTFTISESFFYTLKVVSISGLKLASRGWSFIKQIGTNHKKAPLCGAYKVI